MPRDYLDELKEEIDALKDKEITITEHIKTPEIDELQKRTARLQEEWEASRREIESMVGHSALGIVSAGFAAVPSIFGPRYTPSERAEMWERNIERMLGPRPAGPQEELPKILSNATGPSDAKDLVEKIILPALKALVREGKIAKDVILV